MGKPVSAIWQSEGKYKQPVDRPFYEDGAAVIFLFATI
jgi:hypothetical protein